MGLILSGLRKKREEKKLRQAYELGYNAGQMGMSAQQVVEMQRQYQEELKRLARARRRDTLVKTVFLIPACIIVGFCFDWYFETNAFSENPILFILIYIFAILL